MLTIDLYNQLRGTRFGATEHNLALINKLNSLGVTEEEVKAYKLPPDKQGQHEMRQMASDFSKNHKASKMPAMADPIAPAKKEVTTMPTTSNINAGVSSADALIAALNGVLKAPALDEDQIRAIAKKAAEEVAGIAPRRIEVVTPKATNVIKGVLHEKFQTILTLLSGGDYPLLFGPAGSGKTEIAKQAAEALGLDFYYSGQLSQEYQFTGYTDANGRYQATPFYNAWSKGGLMFFDELTKSDTAPCTRLNGALSGDVFDFPAPIGTVKKHPDFHCIAAGNSIGKGATGSYASENQQDSSFLDRFFPVEVLYDTRIEDAIDKEAAEFVRALRKTVSLAGIDLTLGYRAITKLAKYAGPIPIKEVIKSVITASLSKDDINILKRDQNVKALAETGNKFAKALV